MTRKQSDPNCGTVYKTSKEKSNWCALLDTGGMQFMMADWNLEGWGKTAINMLRLLGKCDHSLCWNDNVTVSMSSSWGIMMLLALTSFKEDTCCNMYSTIIYSSPYSETILICFCEERERDGQAERHGDWQKETEHKYGKIFQPRGEYKLQNNRCSLHCSSTFLQVWYFSK